jgi:hypothetical protein
MGVVLLGEIEWRSLNVGSFVIRYPRAEKAAERAKKIRASKRVHSARTRGATKLPRLGRRARNTQRIASLMLRKMRPAPVTIHS